jgi:hypothetical protein
MNLNELSTQNVGLVGSPVGFVIKSLAHPDRKFKVEAKLGNGKFAITRIDTGANYFVLGTEDRYEFAVTVARIREVKAEIVELEEQAGTIAERLTELKGELGTLGGAVGA